MRALQRGFPPLSCGRGYLVAGRRHEHRSAAPQCPRTARPVAERGQGGRPTAATVLPPAQPRCSPAEPPQQDPLGASAWASGLRPQAQHPTPPAQQKVSQTAVR